MRLLHIGRATSNEIVIADTTVSRQHAQLMIDDQGQVTLIDLGSSNGTFVNGRRINAPTKLDPTDIVKVGEYLLPWRQHVQTSHATPVSAHRDAPVAVAAPVANDIPSSSPTGLKKYIWFIAGGVGVALVAVLIAVWIFGGSAHGNLAGKWLEKENPQAWIQFEENGKYSEGFKGAVVFDNAKWQAMRTDRILIEKDDISISKRYKFEGKYLKITYLGKTIAYEREE